VDQFCNHDSNCGGYCAHDEKYVKSKTFPPCTALFASTTRRVRSPEECPVNMMFTDGYCIKKRFKPDIERQKPEDEMQVDSILLIPNPSPEVPITPLSPQPDQTPDSRNLRNGKLIPFTFANIKSIVFIQHIARLT